MSLSGERGGSRLRRVAQQSRTDGYLFLDNDTNRTMDQMTGAAPLSGSVLGQWRRTLRARQVAMNDLGVDYRLVIAPAKEAALDAQLPAGVTLSERRPARQIAAEPKLAEIVCYPLQALRDLAAAGAQPYPRGDSHFSDAGAYAVYAETMRALNRIGDVLPTWRLKRGESEVIGDLMLNSPNRHADKVTTLTPSPALATTVFNNNRQNRGRIVKTHNPSARLGTLLMFRDSFAETLIPFFAETFKSCIFVWRPYVDFDLVEETRPDVVLKRDGRATPAGGA